MLDVRVAGPAGRLCAVRVSASASLRELRVAIEASTNISAGSQRLFHGLKELTDRDGLQLCSDDRHAHVELLLVRRSQEQMVWLQQLERATRYTPWEAGMWLRDAPAEAREDKEIALAVVALDGQALCFVPRDLQADREVVLTAVTQNRQALVFAAEDLQADAEVRAAAKW